MGSSTAGDASASSSSGPSTSASGTAADAGATHYLAKRVLRGSAVLHVVEGCFRSRGSTDVVLGKETSLELVTVGDDGVLQSICEQDMFGIVKDVGVLQWHSRHICGIPEIECKDLLVVLSDSGKLSLLYFCSEMHRFFAIANIELSKPGNLRHQLGRVLAIDRESNFVAISAYEDMFALVHVSVCQNPHGFGRSTISEKKYFYPPENEEDAATVSGASKTSIRGTIWAMCFISTSMNGEYYPVVAMILHRKGSDVNDLSLFGCNSSSGAVNHVSSYSETGPLALDITEIPEMFGFALLFRVGDILLLDLTNPMNVSCIRRISLTTNFFVDPVNTEDASPGLLDVDDDVAACALLELSDSGNNIVKDEGYMDIDGVDSRGNVKSRIVWSWSWEPLDPVRQGWATLLFCPISGCIPENVRFVAAGRFYIIAGLRNGMLLRFESEASKHYFPDSFYKDIYIPSVSTILQLISIRRIGITPVVLVPMHDSADSDIVVLSDRPWLLHAARHSLAYTSISFLPSHVTPVSSVDCPSGLLFVAENCLHLAVWSDC